jgi:hypothetical protein
MPSGSGDLTASGLVPAPVFEGTPRTRGARGEASGALQMPADLPVRCACGAVCGIARGVAGDRGNRVVCYCDDCQSFAHFLGSVDRILDRHGGTDIFQMSPARLEITEGVDHLACVRLKPRGLLRWYASCCHTPIGNTLASRNVPFVGLIHSCIDPQTAGRSRDEVLGPVRARIHARFAKGDRERLDAHQRAPAWLFLRFLSMLLVARLRGDHTRSPFFDAVTGDPIAPPHVLTIEELGRVEATRDRT